jgi:hypothetical protein
LLGTKYSIAESKELVGIFCTYQEHINMSVRHLSMMKEEITKTLVEKEVRVQTRRNERHHQGLCAWKLYRDAKIR